MRLKTAAIVCATFACGLAAAHELRPAYLDLLETAPGEFAVLWKTPMQADARLALMPVFSGEVTVSDTSAEVRSGAAIQHWMLVAPVLRGQTLRIQGLESTMTDALVHIAFADGTEWTQRFTPSTPTIQIPQKTRNSAPSTPALPAYAFLIIAIASWAAMCVAAAIARTHARGQRRWLIGVAYTIGITFAVLLFCAIVEFRHLA